ncbi:hypothetical protein Pgy4_41649, partial [Pseudomonas savastanoi pv. glycinea str. race 4]
ACPAPEKPFQSRSMMNALKAHYRRHGHKISLVFD